MFSINKKELDKIDNWKLTLIRVGHSTVLINFFWTRILTDPVFEERIGIKMGKIIIWPKRICEPGISLSDLPPIDIVLISHAHLDHLDRNTLKKLTHRFKNHITCITAIHTKKIIADLPRKECHDLDRNESRKNNNISIRAIEVSHRWARFLLDYNNAKKQQHRYSYNGYIIEKNERKIVFGGDTAYTPLFKELKKEQIDIAMMPIGSYTFNKSYHCTPEEAVRMTSEMGAKFLIPLHHQTFILSPFLFLEPLDAPIKRLKKDLMNYPNIRLGLEKIGEIFVL